MPKTQLTPEQKERKKNQQKLRAEKKKLASETLFAQKVADFHEKAIQASRLAEKKRLEEKKALNQKKLEKEQKIYREWVEHMKGGAVLYDEKTYTGYSWLHRCNKIQVRINSIEDYPSKEIDELEFVLNAPFINWSHVVTWKVKLEC
jgi:hypothetical protein